MGQVVVVLFVGGSTLAAVAVTLHGARMKRITTVGTGVAMMSFIVWAWATHQNGAELGGLAVTCILIAAAILLRPKRKDDKSVAS